MWRLPLVGEEDSYSLGPKLILDAVGLSHGSRDQRERSANEFATTASASSSQPLTYVRGSESAPVFCAGYRAATVRERSS